MKKRVITFLVACLTAGALAGCGAKEPVVESSVAAVESNASTESSQSIETGSETAQKEDNSKEIYEAFLEGTEKVYTEKYDGYRYDAEGNKVAYYDTNNGYALGDFLTKTLEIEGEFYRQQQIDSVDYQMIDCGADGVPELLLQVWLTVEEYYPAQRQYVMKAMDGKLQLTYQNESGSYMQEEVYSDTGAVALTSMYSYDYWYEGDAYLDANGQYREVETVQVNMFLPASYSLDARFSAAVLDNEDELQEVYVRVYRIGDAPEEDIADISSLYYCGEKTEDEPSNGYDFEENVRLLQEVFDKSGEKLYSMQEIQNLIAEREKAIGITDAVKQGKELALVELKLKDDWTLSYVNEDAGYNGYEDLDSNVVEIAVYAPDSQIRDMGNVVIFCDEPELTESSNAYVLDEDTVFAEYAEMAFFDGYEDGDTPLTWVRRMLGQQEEYYTALVGIFDFTVSEGHIDSLNGIYWWD